MTLLSCYFYWAKHKQELTSTQLPTGNLLTYINRILAHMDWEATVMRASLGDGLCFKHLMICWNTLQQ
jgi:hypothetical protein